MKQSGTWRLSPQGNKHPKATARTCELQPKAPQPAATSRVSNNLVARADKMAQPTKRRFDYGHPEDPRQRGIYDSNGLKSKEEMPIEVGIDGGMRRASADDLLGVLGYASELTRSRSTWQVAFMSFVLASVPYGLSTTLYYPLVGGGPSAVVWGWVAVCLIILCLAISLGEITSVYPTAGGVYYQTYMICPPWCRHICAYLCGWSYFLGNVIITLAVNFGTTLFFVGCVNIFTDSEGNGIWVAETYQYFLVFLAITLICNAISSLCNKWLPILDVRIMNPSSKEIVLRHDLL